MSYSQIPLTTDPNQTFNITLPVDKKNLTLGFFIYWNNQAQYWCMDIIDKSADKQVLTGIPLLESLNKTQNLIEQFAYLGIGSAFLVNVSGSSIPPNLTNLGTDYLLLWNDTPIKG